MKNFIILLGLTLAFVGCKESCPPIDFSEGIVALKDTTYLVGNSELPNTELRGILIEDVTGVSCNGCPNAARNAAKAHDDISTNEVVIVGIYPTSPRSLTRNITGYEQEFLEARLTTETSQQIAQDIYKVGGNLPGGGVNRKIFSGESEINIPNSTWVSRAQEFVNTDAPVTVEENLTFVNDSTVRLYTKFSFQEDAPSVPFYTLYLLEDKIKYPQKDADSTSYSYVQKHVLRKAYTQYNGNPLLSSGFTEAKKGTTIEKEVDLVIPDFVIQENGSIVILVNYNDGENKEVVQCREIKLK